MTREKGKQAAAITIEQAARELRAAWLEHNRLDKPSKPDYDGSKCHAILDRINALETVIASQMAQTPLEAMMQVVLIESRNDINRVSDGCDFPEFYAEITRMTHSVMAFLERESGIPRRRAGGRQYMPDYLDPFAPIDSVVLGLSRADGEAPRILRAFHEAEYAEHVSAVVDSFARLDSIDDAVAAAVRAQETVDDTLAATPDSTAVTSPSPPDTVVIEDVGGLPAVGAGRPATVGPPAEAGRPGRPTPTNLTPLQGSTPGRTADGRRVLPARRIVLQLSGPLEYEVEYEVQVSGVVNINGVSGGGGATPLLWELPPVDTLPADSLAVDTSAVLDTGAAVDTFAFGGRRGRR